jgi:hypothetical protein
MGLRLILLAVAFITIASILPLEVLRGARILSVAFQTFCVPPAAAGRIILAAFRGGLADIAVFWNRSKKRH